MEHRPLLLGREYSIRYAGAPVQVLFEGVENAAVILDSQYVEVSKKREDSEYKASDTSFQL